MTDAQRRYMKARQRVEAFMLNPTTELLAATADLVNEERRKREASDEIMAQLRPLWAQGYTDDSMAAQATGNALTELWALLYAKDQTAAVANLKRLIADAAKAADTADQLSRLRFPDTTGQ